MKDLFNVMLAVFLVVACTNAKAQDVVGVESEFREQVSEELITAAKRARVAIKSELMTIASRDDAFIVLAPVSTDECDMFGFLSLSRGSSSEYWKVPPGYYLLDITLTSANSRTGSAALKDSSGKVILGGLPVLVEEAPSDAPNRDGLSFTLNATEFKVKRWKAKPPPGEHITDAITIRF